MEWSAAWGMAVDVARVLMPVAILLIGYLVKAMATQNRKIDAVREEVGMLDRSIIQNYVPRKDFDSLRQEMHNDVKSIEDRMRSEMQRLETRLEKAIDRVETRVVAMDEGIHKRLDIIIGGKT